MQKFQQLKSETNFEYRGNNLTIEDEYKLMLLNMKEKIVGGLVNSLPKIVPNLTEPLK
jgi:hypothetical protein